MDKGLSAWSIFMILVTLLLVMLFVISTEVERQTFNRLHHTDYGYGEWFFSRQVILDYTEGKEININLKQNGNK